ncbi:hypothetical protein HRED_07701 [Candidatus Haloredivivus sp. G17]|nr:hypothetical protein HRED_07701 [Candidatus Haloredivivus sp. G17]
MYSNSGASNIPFNGSKADIQGDDEDFAVVFAGMGITEEESQEFIEEFEETGALERSVVFLTRPRILRRRELSLREWR